jgi:hypothetical protein
MKQNHIRRLLMLALVLFLSACAVKPETSVSGFLDAFKNSRTTTSTDFTQYLERDGSSIDFELLDRDMNELEEDGFSEEMSLILLDQLYGFDYTIHGSTLSSDKNQATVSLTLRTYPLRDNFIVFLQAYLPKAFEWALSGLSEDEMMTRVTLLFKEAFVDSEKTYVNTVDVKLIKQDDGWLISDSDDNDDFFDALFGGLYTFSLDTE